MRITRRDMMMGAMGAALMPGSTASAGTSQIGGPAFGSSWRATFVGPTDPSAMRGLIQSVIAEVDACFSPYRRDSDLSRFNASLALSWQTPEPALVDVASEALYFATLTDGYFDPTVGPLVARHGFGPISGLPASFRDIEAHGQMLRKASPKATLDLCGIAKGYALDRVIRELDEAGAGAAIVDIGGEVRALGYHPDGRPWTVAIADPRQPGKARRVVALHGLVLATSGHAANGVRGRAHTSHIMDPLRQRPAKQELLSVSVLDPSAMRADALATALCAAGPDAGLKLARRLDVPAYFILETSERMTGGFDAHVLA